MRKLLFVAGAVVGYVLGSRAGRERYEQLRSQMQRMWHDPRVQRSTSEATDAIRTRAPMVKDKLAHAVRHSTLTPGSRRTEER